MNGHMYMIRFEGATPEEARTYASELRDALLDAGEVEGAEIRREDSQSMDFGSILEITLNASAVVTTVAAIGAWLKIRSSASLSFQTRDGKYIAKNLTARDAARLTEKLIDMQKRHDNQ